MNADTRDLVDPAFFSQLDSVELRARSIVEGFLNGLHRSPYVGFSVEFASHREYVPGDDLRHVNWKLYARQRRLYVKEYHAETNLNLYLMLDTSASMACSNSGTSKLRYGASLAAAMAHLALKQQDAVGLTLYSDDVSGHVAPRSKTGHLDSLLQLIATAETRPTGETGRGLHLAAELASHRGMVVVVTDLFDDFDAIVDGLEHLRFKNHEVILFHVMDPWERRLPIDGNIRFRDLETGEEVTTQAEGIREEYQRSMDAWCDEIDHECLTRGIDRVELTTDQPLDGALFDYLVRRSQV